MELEGKFSNSLTAFIVYCSAMGNIIYTFTQVTLVSGRPFWIAVLLGVLLLIPFAVWVMLLGSYLPNGSIFDLLEKGLGKTICRISILLYWIITIAITVMMLNLFAGSVKIFFLPRTPELIVMLLIISICTFFAQSGIKFLSRLACVLCLLATINYFFGFSVSFFGNIKLENITPILDTTPAGFISGMLMTAGSDSECLLLLMVIVGDIPQTKKHYLSMIKGLSVWSLVLSSAVLIMEGITGQKALSAVVAAGITVASDIQVGTFFSGLEVFIMMTYQYIAFAKIALALFCCWTVLKKFFNVPKGLPLLIFSAAALFAASIWLNSVNKSFYYAVFLGNSILPAFIILMLLLGTLSAIRIKNSKGKETK